MPYTDPHIRLTKTVNGKEQAQVVRSESRAVALEYDGWARENKKAGRTRKPAAKPSAKSGATGGSSTGSSTTT